MGVLELLEELRRREIHVALDGSNLKVNAPTGALDDSLKASLRAHKAEVLAWLRAASENADDDAPLVARDPESSAPASFLQQRLWFLQQIEASPAAYNMPNAFWLRGPLDAGALEKAVQDLAARHAVLSACLEATAGDLLLRPGAPVAFHAPEGRASKTEAEKIAVEEANRPFDLSTGPMLRARLVEVDDHLHLLMLTLHHAAADGWSLGVMFRDLEALYAARLVGRPADLPRLAVQFGDFARWQREVLTDDRLERDLGYWRQQLAGVGHVDLPTDRPRPPRQTFRGQLHDFSIPPETAARAKALAGGENSTLFMVVLAAFKALLSRYSRDEDIIVGTAVAGRTKVELEDLIGPFINTLPLRTDLSENPSFRELIARVRSVVLGAHTHQATPFERLVTEAQPERDLSRSPLFQIMFMLDSGGASALSLSGLEVEPYIAPHVTAKFDLTLYIQDRGTLEGTFEFNADLFDEATIAAMGLHLTRLLDGLCRDPDARIRSVPLLNEAEGRALVAANRAFDADYPQDRCFHELFEERVRAAPERTAIVFGDQRVSYGELNRRANALAYELRRLGATPNTLVGLLVERSVGMVVGALGILKSGAAYVPLDPGYPEDRIAFILEDAAVDLLVTEEGSLPSLEVRRVNIDGFALAAEGRDDLASAASAQDLAYVIYTSGSTGKPKGVQIPHRALVNFLCSVRQRPGLVANDILLAVTTISFDIAALELYLPLLVGGSVVLADRMTASDGKRLQSVMEREQVTVMQATPATWRLLLDSGWRGRPSLKAMCGGEALPRPLANRIRANSASLWNMYGPTETTIWSLVEEVEVGDGPVALGVPLANTQIYVVDQGGHLAPPQVSGELLIGGDGLARGYLNRPELTAERFILNPYVSGAHDRLYRTGDVVRRKRTGALEFLGRVDHQIKLRGHRIELGEIEAALTKHSAVSAVAVVTRTLGEADVRLVAFVEFTDDEEPTSSELRDFVRKSLPEYMVPSIFAALPALPLTPNGKIDRRSLPAIEGYQGASVAFIEPKSALQREIASLWAELLGCDRVGLDDNFFDLGGHSLLAMQVVVTLEERTGTRVNPLEMVLRNLEQFAGMYEQGTDETAPSRAIHQITPLFFSSSTEPLFGTYHPARGAVAGRSGVVVCPPIGPDFVPSFATVRELAAALAKGGHHVLRFDFFGTGDSAGAEGEGTVAHWVKDVDAAIRELRDIASLNSVSIVGLRFGATVAALAAAGRADVERVALWEPFDTGAAYLNELQSRHRAYLRDVLPPPSPRTRQRSAGEYLGAPYPADLEREIRGIEIRSNGAWLADKTLVIGRTSSETGLIESLRRQGKRAEHRVVDGPRFWARSDEVGDTPIPRRGIETLAKFLESN